MALDPIESLAVIPNATDNFDEVWMVVNRLNGRFIERMSQRLKSIDCGGEQTVLLNEQVMMDSTISYDTSFDIESISQGTTTTITTETGSGLSSGDIVNIACASEFNGRYKLGSVDSDTSDVILYLRFNGDDGSETFTDLSTFNHSVTPDVPGGNTQLDTDVKKLGSASLFSDYNIAEDGDELISVADNSIFNISTTTNRTWEFYVNWLDLKPAGNTYNMFYRHDGVDNNTMHAEELTAGELTFRWVLNDFDGGGNTVVSSSEPISLNQWYHVAYVKNGTSLKIYLDGTEIASDTLDGLFVSSFPGAVITICQRSHWHIDEYIVTDRAKYTSNFTPPTSELELSSTDSFTITDVDTGDDLNSSTFTAYTSGGFMREEASTFTGLDHLESEDVSIIADGVSLPTQTVSGGSVTTSTAYKIVHVGLPYHSDLETLNVELTSDFDTLQGRKVKIGNVSTRFVDSRGGFIGDSESNIYDAFTNLMVTRNQTELDFNESLTTLNVATRLYSGHIRVPLGSRYRNGGRVFYRQDKPYPVTISQIIPEVEVGGPI